MTFNIGEAVSLVQPVIRGQVKDTEYDREAGVLKHLVTYTDAEGDTQERWFFETQLEQDAQ